MTVLGKSFVILILTTNSLLAANWDGPIFNNPMRPDNSLFFLYNLFRSATSFLPQEDSLIHEQAVYFALNNLKEEEVVEWFGQAKTTLGKVKIAVSWPHSGGYCRRVYSFIQKSQDKRGFQQTACWNTNSNSWTWTDK